MTVKDLLKNNVRVITYINLKPDLVIIFKNKYDYAEIRYGIDLDLNSVTICLNHMTVKYRTL